MAEPSESRKKIKYQRYQASWKGENLHIQMYLRKDINWQRSQDESKDRNKWLELIQFMDHLIVVIKRCSLTLELKAFWY